MKTIDVSTVTLGTASQVLTSNNTTPSDADTVTIGTKVYTFKTALTPTEGEVLINGSADAALLNLIRAINHTGTPDTDYKCAEANAQVSAGSSVTSHTITVSARTAGLDGNSIATTTTAATLSWGAATLAGGQTISVAGTVSDQDFGQPSKSSTVYAMPEANTSFARNFRVTNQGVFCVRTGEDGAAMSAAAWAKLATALDPGLSWAPRFSTQPASASCTAAGSATFTSVQDATDEFAATFQWSRSADNGLTWVAITGASTPSDSSATYSNWDTAALTVATPSLAMSGYLYKCTATSAAGATDSNAVTLTVTGSAPVPIAPPSDQSCVHDSTAATFTCTIGGSELTYQWEVSAGGGDWVNVVESTSLNPTPYTNSQTAALTVTPWDTSLDGLYYRCTVTNPQGHIHTGGALLTVT